MFSRIKPQVFRDSYLLFVLNNEIIKLDNSNIKFRTMATIINVKQNIIEIKVSPKYRNNEKSVVPITKLRSATIFPIVEILYMFLFFVLIGVRVNRYSYFFN